MRTANYSARRWLFWIILAALVVRLVPMGFVYTDRLNPKLDHWAFGYEMGRIGRSLTAGQGYSSPFIVPTGPTAFQAPAYPYLVAAVFKLFGVFTPASAIVLLTLNCIFSSLNCLPVFFIARRAFDSETAIWAGWAWAIFPFSVYTSVRWIWDTCLTTFLLSLLLLWAMRLEKVPRLSEWLGFGLLWGLTALLNPATVLVLPFLLWWLRHGLRRRGIEPISCVGIAVLMFAFTVAPWFIRNYRTFGAFIFFRDNFGLELQAGNNDDTRYPLTYSQIPGKNPAEMERVRRMGELPYMAEKRREAFEYIAYHPGAFAWRTLRRIICFWTGFWSFPLSGQDEEDFRAISISSRTVLALLALLGLRRAIARRRESTTPLAIVLASYPVLYYVTHPSVRYAHLLDPILVLLATFAVRGTLRAKRNDTHTTPPVHAPSA